MSRSGRLGDDPRGSGGRLKAFAAIGVSLALLWTVAILMLASGPDGAAPAANAENGGPAATAQDTVGAARSTGSEGPGAIEGRPVADDREGPAPGSGEREPPEGGVHEEPALHDPLGTGARPGDLSETERGRVEQAASQFVIYAYGYSGDDPDQYTAGVNQAVIPDPFYESPGAAYVEEFARRVESGGTSSTATLQAFEITEVSGERAEGVARFTIEDPSGTKRLSQELHVRRLGAIWRVSGAGIIEEV
jgi:hypothetical protein